MANRYRIALSKPDEALNLADVNGVSKLHPVIDIEKKILSGLLDFAANSYKKQSDINPCLDLQGQIECLPDGAEYIIIDDMDKKNLEIGIEKTVEQRPFIWYRCRSLWKQLEIWPVYKEE